MDKKTISKFRTRINRAQNTLSVCGDMLLTMDIDSMPLSELIELRDGLLDSRKPLSYKYLDQRLEILTAQDEQAAQVDYEHHYDYVTGE